MSFFKLQTERKKQLCYHR